MAEKILIRTPNHLGDCVMALPMINETREAHPGSTVTVLVPEPMVSLFRNNLAIDELIPFPSKYLHGLIAVTKIKELLQGKDLTMAYILPPSFGAAAGIKLAGIKERVGSSADGRRLLLSKPLPLPVPLHAEHRSELYFNLLRRGAQADLNYTKPKIFFNDDEINHARTILAGFGLADSQSFIVIAFQAVAESRRWGQDNYTELCKQLITHCDQKIVLVGGETDHRVGEAIVEAAGKQNVINLSGKTDIRETASVMSLAALFIGNDSGPAHLAAASGIPVVILSGADDPRSTSPMAADKVLLYEDKLGCISCVKNKCPLKGDEFMACMKLITVNRVLEAARLFL